MGYDLTVRAADTLAELTGAAAQAGDRAATLLS
jgi:hypothetical protein